MARLDELVDEMQDAIDNDDIELICATAALISAICGVVGKGPDGGDSARAVAVRDPEGDALYDPDELGLDPEDFDIAVWRKLR